MKRWVRDMPLTMDEVRGLMHKKDKQSKWLWIGIGVSVVCSLVAIALWVCNKRDRDMEHYFEYFDDEDFDDDFDYEDFDEDYEVEHVEIVLDDEDEHKDNREEDKDQIELPE